tara:strand:- start:2605 stop:2715 length:111 start_codon:yes stop_codon:yes gene_type:complete
MGVNNPGNAAEAKIGFISSFSLNILSVPSIRLVAGM